VAEFEDRSPDDAPLTPDRRSFLKTAGIAGAAGAVAGAAHGKFGLAPIASAQAQPAAPPKLTTGKWWPSKWGPEDEAGASSPLPRC
jgi:TAT (twin-arginine translocation) pathway signal sequence